MDLRKIKVIQNDRFQTTGERWWYDLYKNDINKYACDELCASVFSIFANGKQRAQVKIAGCKDSIIVKWIPCANVLGIILSFSIQREKKVTSVERPNDTDNVYSEMQTESITEGRSSYKTSYYGIFSVGPEYDSSLGTDVKAYLKVTRSNIFRQESDINVVASMLPELLAMYFIVMLHGNMQSVHRFEPEYKHTKKVIVDMEWYRRFTYGYDIA